VTFGQHLAFALRLQHHLFPDGDRNSCWSPLSVASCLGLLTEATSGTTRRELVKVLLGSADIDYGRAGEHAAYLAQAATLPLPTGRRRSGYQPPALTVTNTLWADESVRVDTAFVEDDLSVWPNGTVRIAPFAAAPEDSRALVNGEVAMQTRDLIPQLLAAGSVTEDTLLLLVNALYLRTSWTTPFRRRATQQGMFHAPTGQTAVDMMSGTAEMRYAHAHDWELVDIPALGGVSVTVLLPRDPLAEAEHQLVAPRLASLVDSLLPEPVELVLPRLSIRSRPALMPALRGLGVDRLFSDQADLGGLVHAGGDPVAVSAMATEALLRVDEDGLEGAAATTAVVRRSGASRVTPIPVTVDRPFLLLVRHRFSGVVYFLARVTHP
jgi:serine protease inhibitor